MYCLLFLIESQGKMIEVKRINGRDLIINAELIEFIEVTPDTIISMSTGKKIIVKDTPEEVIKKVLEYRREIFPLKKFKKLTEEEIYMLNLNIDKE